MDKIKKEVTVSTNDESSKLVSEISRPLNYDCNTSQNNEVHCDAVKPNHGFHVPGTERIPLKVVHENSKEADCSFETEMSVQTKANQMKQSKEVCEWEKFVSEASGILNCHSPTKESYHDELDERSADPGMLSFVATVLQPPNEHMNDPRPVCPVISENHQMDLPSEKPVEIGNLNERTELPSGNDRAVHAEEVVQYKKTEKDDKVGNITVLSSGLYFVLHCQAWHSFMLLILVRPLQYRALICSEASPSYFSFEISAIFCCNLLD